MTIAIIGKTGVLQRTISRCKRYCCGRVQNSVRAVTTLLTALREGVQFDLISFYFYPITFSTGCFDDYQVIIMVKRNKYFKRSGSEDSNAWVLTTKRVGDNVAGWMVERLFEHNVRKLDASERCALTSYCYPTGAKLVRAKLLRAEPEAVSLTQ